MGIYNRDYYRELNVARGDGAWGLPGLTPVVKWLILANVAVWLLQIFAVREVHVSALERMRKFDPVIDKYLTEKENGEDDSAALKKLLKKYPHLEKLISAEDDDTFAYPERISVVQEWFQLDTKKVVYEGQVWRLLTHAFCHERYFIFHILFNMLCLYWFGCTLETLYGSREFLLFYLTAAVVAALAFVGMDLYTGSTSPGIGASGAVMAVMMLYTMHFPCETICLCWFFPLEMRWVMVLYVIWDLHPILLALAGDRVFTGIAHAAHLGGLAFGFLYAKYQWRLDDLTDWITWPRSRWRRRPRLRVAPEPPPTSEPRPDADMARVDEVLQKIIDSGQASLTEEERSILRTASEQLKRRPNRDG